METISEKIKRFTKESQKTWGIGYGHLSKVINERNLKIGAEIGVAFGGHSEAILKQTQVEKLYGIDPYQQTIGYIDSMNWPQEEFDILYEMTIDRLTPYGNRYTHIRKYSKEAAAEIKGQLDFVYIDADHSYDGVWKDLCIWFGKIREGGIISGHDYMHPDFPGVQRAIDEFFGRFGWKVNYEGDNVWWVEKKSVSISFFIPAFNCERTIGESIRSIVDTNFSDGDEIVICNDFSTDGTAQVLAEFANKYPFIKIIDHIRNKGGATARNTAIENTKNELLFCLDSDNILAPRSIAPLKKYMMEIGADAAAFQNTYFFVDNTEVLHKKVALVSGLVTIKDCLEGKATPPPSGNYLFTKSSWLKAGGYPDGNWLDTWGLGIRQLFTGAKMYTLPGSFYFHRRGHESYYVREVKKTPVSLVALELFIPYLSRLSDRSVNYILGRGRYTWFENLKKHPINIKETLEERRLRISLFKETIKEKFPQIYSWYIQMKK